MKLVRFGKAGSELPGLVDSNGGLRDLSGEVDDIGPSVLAPRSLARLRKIRADRLPLVSGKRRLGVPVAGVGKIIGVGLNYSDHAAETGMQTPREPVLFMKAVSSLSGPNDSIVLPRGSRKCDWEVELGVVVGGVARCVTGDAALAHVAGYCILNDVSEREFQLERGGQWDKGKGCDTFCPVGPWLVTADEVGDPQQLELWLELNGQHMQQGSTANMIFGVAQLVSYISSFMTLMPGDIIATGTPAGVGMGRKPPRFLVAGDVLRLGVTKLGAQCQTIRPPA